MEIDPEFYEWFKSLPTDFIDTMYQMWQLNMLVGMNELVEDLKDGRPVEVSALQVDKVKPNKISDEEIILFCKQLKMPYQDYRWVMDQEIK